MRQALQNFPWVLLPPSADSPDCRHVKASQLCFPRGAEDTGELLFPVPPVLLSLLSQYPSGKELLLSMGAIDLQSSHGMPPLVQKHAVLIPGSANLPLVEAFDNPEKWPDAVIQVQGRDIHVHRLIIGYACSPLERLWEGRWADSQGPIVLGETTYPAAW